ncbi:MAG TPA: hypothetical protein PKO06_23855, partial [Candidatus Ozemobacteraceae bacterium]|nr:hypothetical protein [Candidatus Ozemobacteraceae bacterium]
MTGLKSSPQASDAAMISSYSSAMKAFVDELMRPIRTTEVPTSLALVGPGKFFIGWARFVGNPEDALGDQMMNTVMSLICRDHLVRANPQLREEDETDSPTSPGLTQDTVKAGMMKEEFVKMLRDIAGPDTFLHIFKFPQRVTEIGVGSGRMFFCFLPVRWQGVVRYLMYPNWTESIVDLPFITETLSASSSGNIYPGIFACLKNPETQRISQRFDSIPAGLAAHPDLSALVKAVRVSNTPLREYNAKSDRILEAIPARHINLFILAGERSAEHLRDRASHHWNLFLAVLGFILLLSIGVAFSLAEYFLAPLKRVLLGIAEIDAGNYRVHLDGTR